MKNKTFPFYAEATEYKSNTINFIDCLNFFETLRLTPEDIVDDKNLKYYYILEFFGFFDKFKVIFGKDSTNNSWPLGNCYGGKENLYLNVFVKFTKNLLESSEFDETKDIISKELNAINDTIIYKDYNIGELLTTVQDSILNTGTADEKLTSILHELLLDHDFSKFDLTDKNKWIYLCYYLFKFIPKDFNITCKLMEQINTNIENHKIKYCYSIIYSFGMKILTYSLTYKHSPDMAIIRELRRYSELFCMATDLLFFLPVPSTTYTKQSSGMVIQALIKASYTLGAIDREKEFYSKESLDFMSSLGLSHKMNEIFKQKYENCEKFAQEAEYLWKNGDKRRHNEMADYLLAKHNKAVEDKEEEEHHVTKSLLLPRLKVIAENYGLARGIKKKK